jgi:hypothetical protein
LPYIIEENIIKQGNTMDNNYNTIISILNKIYKTQKKMFFIDNLFLLINISLIVVVLHLSLDIFVCFSKSFRIAFLYSYLILFFLMLNVIIFKFLKNNPKYSNLAKILENKYPALSDNVTNVMQISNSYYDLTEVTEYCIKKAVNFTKDKTLEVFNLDDFKRTNHKRKLYFLLICVFSAVLYFSYANGYKYSLNRFLHSTNMEYDLNLIQIIPKSVNVLYGSDVKINIITKNQNYIPVLYISKSTTDWTKIKLINISSNTYECVIPEVTENTKYFARIGLIKTETYNINVVLIPSIGNIEIKLQYPNYTNLGISDYVRLKGEIEVLRGTKIYLRASVNKNPEKAFINYANKISTMTISGLNIEGSFTASFAKEYYLDVTDFDGLKNKLYKNKIVFLQDNVPVIESDNDVKNLYVDYRQDIPIKFHALDDYGISKINLIYIINDGRKNKLSVQGLKGEKTIDNVFSWGLSRYGLKNGDKVKYYFEAYDNYPYSDRPSAGYSDAQIINIIDTKKKDVVYEKSINDINELISKIIDKQNNLNETVKSFNSISSQDEVDKFKDKFKILQSSQNIVFNQYDALCKNIESLTKNIEKEGRTQGLFYVEYKNILNDLKYVKNNNIKNTSQNFDNVLNNYDYKNINNSFEEIKNEQNEFLRYMKNLSSRQKIISDKRDEINTFFDINYLKSSCQSVRDEIFGKKVIDGNKVVEKINKMQELVKKLNDSVLDLYKQGKIKKSSKENIDMDFGSLMQRVSELKKDVYNEENLKTLGYELNNIEQQIEKLKDYKNNIGNKTSNEQLEKMFKEFIANLNDVIKEEEFIQSETLKLDQKRIKVLLNKQNVFYKNLVSRFTNIKNEFDSKLKILSDKNINNNQNTYFTVLFKINNALGTLIKNLQTQNTKDVFTYIRNFSSNMDLWQNIFTVKPSVDIFYQETKEKIQEEGFKKECFAVFYDLKDKVDKINDEIDLLSIVTPIELGDETKLQSLGFAEKQKAVKEKFDNVKKFIIDISTSVIIPQEIVYQFFETQNSMTNSYNTLNKVLIEEALLNENKSLESLYAIRDYFSNESNKEDNSFSVSVYSEPETGAERYYPNTFYKDLVEGVVLIPKENDYKVPERFRGEILKISKQKYSKKYEGLIREYYKKIME